MLIINYADASPFSNDKIYEYHFSLMPDFRRKKAERLRLRSARNLCVASWSILSETLKSSGINLNKADFDYAPGGKPYLKSHPEFHISISHTGSLAVCAVSDTPVGIDAEKISGFNEGVCRRFFSDNEYNYVFSADNPEERNFRFYRIWVLKESFIKYTGRGISGLGDFEFLTDSDNVKLHHYKSEFDVNFFEHEIPGYKIAVCTQNSIIDSVSKINLTYI